MCEFSTFYFLTQYVSKITERYFHPLNIKIDSKQLKDTLDFAYCTKKELKNFIEQIEQITEVKYKSNIKTEKHRKYFYSICAYVLLAIIILLIVIVLIVIIT